MRESRLRPLGLLILFGLAYAATRWVSFAFSITPPGIAALWLPAGLLLGVLLRRPSAEWPAIFAVALAASFAVTTTPGPWSGTLLFAGAALVDAAVSGLIIRRLVGVHPRLDRLREVFALALVPSLIGEPIAAAIAAGGQQYLFHTHHFWQVWTLWWSANTLGQVIGVPLVLTAPSHWHWPRGRAAKRATRLTALTVLVAAVTLVLFTHPLTLDAGPALGWIVFPLIALAAVRFGPIGAAATSAAYGLISVWGTVHGQGPFASLAVTATDRVLWLNLFLEFTVFAALVLAAADSEHRQIVRALRESEGKYRSIFENAPDAIFRTTPEGRYAEANPATAKMLGYDSPEQLMQEVTDVTEIYADPEQRRNVLQRLRTEGQIPTIDVEMRRRDGSTAWVAMSLQVVRDANGVIQYVEGVGEDVTDRRVAKEQSDHLQRQLFQAQKMESLGTLAGGIAHDFNNILAAIVGMIDLAALTLPEDHRARRHIKDALRASERAGELIERVLAFSQQHAEESRPEDLVPIATEAARLMRAALPPSIRIETSFAPDMPAVLVNSTQLRQVLVNLMTNAGQAMEETGGELRVALDVVVPDEELRRDAPRLGTAPYVRITVSDTGHGMEARTMERIFEPFFTTKRPGEGTGLGLAVVHGIVEQHDGAVTVQSGLGLGTTFCVFLPAHDRVPVITPHDGAPVTRGHAERLLFVDDEPMLAQAGQLYLTELGYHVRGFVSALEALAAFRESPESFDAVITDLTMPDASGLELADEMHLIRPDIPIILATGYRGSLNDGVLRAHGIHAVLLKPYMGARLAATLREALASRSSSTT